MKCISMQIVINASSVFLDSSSDGCWQDLTGTLQARAATTLLATVENSAFLVANYSENRTRIILYPNTCETSLTNINYFVINNFLLN